MKTINRTYRDIQRGESPIQKTPITELSQASNLADGSLLHIVTYEDGKYESKKMVIEDFKQKIYESVQNTFKTSYWNTHEDIVGESAYKHVQDEKEYEHKTSFRDLVEYLKDKNYAPDEIEKDDPDGFVKHIYWDFDVLKRYVVLKDGDIEGDVDTLGGRVDEVDCGFTTSMDYASTAMDSNVEVVVTNETLNHNLTENDTYCQISISAGNKISNEWTCPASGNLVIYGWLDSSACLNNKATPSAFCAIEGKINGAWEIISVSPVAPAKTLTYVGFNIVVKQDLTIRARTGFTCGAKSGQSSNQQDGFDTLGNSCANGFKCMIYSCKKNEERTDNQ